MMDLNTIKKELYKQNPVANLIFILKGVVEYQSKIKDENDKDLSITFHVPVEDMGDAAFFESMSAKLLIRYLVTNK
jgi:hypothetical protein